MLSAITQVGIVFIAVIAVCLVFFSVRKSPYDNLIDEEDTEDMPEFLEKTK